MRIFYPRVYVSWSSENAATFERTGYAFNYKEAKEILDDILREMKEYVNESLVFNPDPEKSDVIYSISISTKSDTGIKISDDKAGIEILEYIRFIIPYSEDPFEHMMEVSQECRLLYDKNGTFYNAIFDINEMEDYDLFNINNYLSRFGLSLENTKYL